MILNAYYDESGTHAGSPVTVMAGLVGDLNDWIEFDREWKKVLRKYGLTYVHAKHLFHRQGQHKNWSEEKRWRLIADLMYVLQERKEIFVSRSFLLESEFSKHYLSRKPERRERLDSRYALCFRSFLHFLPDFHREHFSRGQIDFILEDGHRNAGDALRVFKEIKEDKDFLWRDTVGKLSFGRKEGYPALQAADLFAYLHNKTINEHLAEKEEFWISGIEDELLDAGLSIVSHLISPHDLQTMRQNYHQKKKRKIFQQSVLFEKGTFEIIGPSTPHLLPWTPSFKAARY
jgi:hypothetical protein